MSLAPTLLQRRKREAMLEIATTSLDLFDRDGFDATTVESIAAAAGCSPRTFYRYFGSKEDVVSWTFRKPSVPWVVSSKHGSPPVKRSGARWPRH